MALGNTVILCGARIDDYAWLGAQIGESDRIICVDSGLRHAHAIGLTPHIIIGDFDSVDPDLLDHYRTKCDVIHDCDQNTTDLMKALCYSQGNPLVHKKANSIMIYGAIGERADHDFSNYLILMGLKYPDAILLCSPNETRRIVTKDCVINGKTGDYVGLFPLCDIIDFKTEGLKYSPNILGEPYKFGWNGACNQMVLDTALISFSKGTILITHSQCQ